MEKLKFWFVVGLVAAVWIYLFKGLASQTNVPSLKKFAETL